MDESGKIRDGAKDIADLKLRPETHALVMKNGVRLTRRLELPPGGYQLRIGAREANGGLVGSVMYDLDVPDFSKTDLSMGGILLTASSAGRIPTANPDPDFKDILPGSPTAVRVFPIRRPADARGRRLRQQGGHAAPGRNPHQRHGR